MIKSNSICPSMLFFLMLLILSSQLSCVLKKKQDKEKQNSKIKNIDNSIAKKNLKKIKLVSRLSKGEPVWFYYTDKFDDTQPPFEMDMNKDTLHEIYSSSPVLLFTANNMQTPYLIYPGETIIITESGQLKDINLKVKDDSIRNNELNFFKIAQKKIDKKHSPAIFSILNNSKAFLISSGIKPNFKSIIGNAREKYTKEIVFLNNYNHQYKLSPYYIWFCKKYFFYSMVLDELIPFTPQKYKPFSYPKDYLKELSLHRLDFMCDSCLNILPYRVAVDYYLKFLSREDLNSKNDFTDMWEKAKNNFTDKTKSYLLFHLVKNRLQNNPTSYHFIKDKFYADCSDESYKNYILKNYEVYLSLKKDKTIKNAAFINDKGEILTWDCILKKNVNKLIYIDFWASWCVPCRKEIPYSQTLHKKYSKQNVAFIYISIDEKRSNWLDAIKELKMATGGSYLLLNVRNSKLLEYLKVSSIPRYLLVNSQGNIVDLNAPRPSEPEINKKFSELLKQNTHE